MVENRITVVQALDERDLLVKRIVSRTQKAQFVDIMKPKAVVTWEKRLPGAAFAAEAQGTLQQIQDLIARYDRLNAAITLSNATTVLETSRGRMTVACAIALRNRLRGSTSYGTFTDFEGRLAEKMEDSYQETRELLRRKNEGMRRETVSSGKNVGFGKKSTHVLVLQENGSRERHADASARMEERRYAGRAAERERTGGGTEGKRIGGTAEGRHGSSTAGERHTGGAAGERQIGSTAGGQRQEREENAMRMVDPLDIRKRAEEILEQRDALLTELETRIKISNATTFITL